MRSYRQILFHTVSSCHVSVKMIWRRLKFDLSVRYRYYCRFHVQDSWALGYFNPGDLEQINFKDPKDSFWFSFQVFLSLN